MRVGANNGFIEWSPTKDSLTVDRLNVIGVSTDPHVLCQELSPTLSNRYFAIICEERIIAFIANDEQQAIKWIDYVQKCVPKMTMQDYNFYRYINDESQI